MPRLLRSETTYFTFRPTDYKETTYTEADEKKGRKRQRKLQTELTVQYTQISHYKLNRWVSDRARPEALLRVCRLSFDICPAYRPSDTHSDWSFSVL